MICESFEVKELEEAKYDFKEITLLSIATSIDALAVGIMFAMLDTNIYFASFIIGITAFILSFIGVIIGNIYGAKHKNKAEITGGTILVLLGITASIGLLASTLLVTLMLIATSVFVIATNNLVCQKLKIEKTIGIFGMLIVCAIALWALELIPYVGTIIAFVAGILGLGIISYSIIFKREKKQKDNIAKD